MTDFFFVMKLYSVEALLFELSILVSKMGYITIVCGIVSLSIVSLIVKKTLLRFLVVNKQMFCKITGYN